MTNPSAYATHTEIEAANQLYNIQIPITFAGEHYPTPPGANTCYVLYSNEHYSTLQFNNPSSSSQIIHSAYYPLWSQATPSRFPHYTYKLHLRNSYSSIFDACPPVLHKGNYLLWWLRRFPLCDTVDPSLIPGICLDIRRCSCRLLISPFSNIVPQHSFPPQIEIHGSFFLRYVFQLATPPGFHVSHIPKGNLAYKFSLRRFRFPK